MNHREWLIARARIHLARTGVIPTTLVMAMYREGIDVEAIERKYS